MRVIITGATGLIGRAVVGALKGRSDEVVVLTRDRDSAASALSSTVELHEWRDPTAAPPTRAALAGADAVINLLGEPVAQRWTQAAKRRIRDSRVLGTHNLVTALAQLAADERPRTLVSQSATGYYGARVDQRLDERAPAGTDFLAQVTVAWEREASAAPPGVRVALTRTGVVLAPAGGAMAKMLPPFRLGLGGPVAGGSQYVPWIHLADVVAALLRCVDDDRLSGPVNLTAPNPVRNRELARTLGAVLRRPAVLPVPAAALRLIYGEMASVVTGGQNAVPARLTELGYAFTYSELAPALTDVV